MNRHVGMGGRGAGGLVLALAIAAASWASAEGGGGRAGPDTLRERRMDGMQVRDMRVDEALGVLRATAEAADPRGEGVNIVYRGPPPETLPRITLHLRNVSLHDALRYITESVGLTFRVQERAVVITSARAPEGRLVTRFYPVSPAIMDTVRAREAQQPRERDPWR